MTLILSLQFSHKLLLLRLNIKGMKKVFFVIVFNCLISVALYGQSTKRVLASPNDTLRIDSNIVRLIWLSDGHLTGLFEYNKLGSVQVDNSNYRIIKGNNNELDIDNQISENFTGGIQWKPLSHFPPSSNTKDVDIVIQSRINPLIRRNVIVRFTVRPNLPPRVTNSNGLTPLNTATSNYSVLNLVSNGTVTDQDGPYPLKFEKIGGYIGLTITDAGVVQFVPGPSADNTIELNYQVTDGVNPAQVGVLKFQRMLIQSIRTIIPEVNGEIKIPIQFCQGESITYPFPITNTATGDLISNVVCMREDESSWIQFDNLTHNFTISQYRITNPNINGWVTMKVTLNGVEKVYKIRFETRFCASNDDKLAYNNILLRIQNTRRNFFQNWAKVVCVLNTNIDQSKANDKTKKSFQEILEVASTAATLSGDVSLPLLIKSAQSAAKSDNKLTENDKKDLNDLASIIGKTLEELRTQSEKLSKYIESPTDDLLLPASRAKMNDEVDKFEQNFYVVECVSVPVKFKPWLASRLKNEAKVRANCCK